MSQLSGIEEKLNKVFVTEAPYQLPEKAKKSLVQYLPIINLVIGVITIWSALQLWRWAHAASRLVDYANDLSRAFGGKEVAAERLSFMLWVSLLVLLAEGVMWIAAYPGLKAHKKAGWNLLFYATILNAVYAVVVAFTDYGGVSNTFSALIGTVLGLYLLFQVRSHYTGEKTVAKK